MEKMKHLDGHAPSAEDTAKLNEIVTWLVDHGYGGIVLVHKGGDFGYAVAFRPGFDAFPTREALCDHYRKIFE